MSDLRLAEVRQLKRGAPRDRIVRASVGLLVLAVVWVWLFSGVSLVEFGGPGSPVALSDAVTETFSQRSYDNLERFSSRLIPAGTTDEKQQRARRAGQFSSNPALQAVASIYLRCGFVLRWGWALLAEKGLSAMATTLAVAVSAIVLAALCALPILWLGSRNLAKADPLVAGGRRPGSVQLWRWRGQAAGVRGLFVFLRALPEYVLAFVLVVLGPGAWPAVLALAIHNFGILGRLGSEVVENTDPAAARNARAAGATRTQIAALVLFPQTLSRMLLYFFYRWESCVRESVVLGMLGVATLGYYIKNDAGARLRYDEMLLYLMLGAVLVLAGDLVSALVRRWVRNA